MAFPKNVKKGKKAPKFAKAVGIKVKILKGPAKANMAKKLMTALAGSLPKGTVKGKKSTSSIKMGIVPNRDY